MHDLEFPSEIKRNKYMMANKKSYKKRTHFTTRHFLIIHLFLKYGCHRVIFRRDGYQKSKTDKIYSKEKRYVFTYKFRMFVCFMESGASFKSEFAIL